MRHTRFTYGKLENLENSTAISGEYCLDKKARHYLGLMLGLDQSQSIGNLMLSGNYVFRAKLKNGHLRIGISPGIKSQFISNNFDENYNFRDPDEFTNLNIGNTLSLKAGVGIVYSRRNRLYLGLAVPNIEKKNNLFVGTAYGLIGNFDKVIFEPSISVRTMKQYWVYVQNFRSPVSTSVSCRMIKFERGERREKYSFGMSYGTSNQLGFELGYFIPHGKGQKNGLDKHDIRLQCYGSIPLNRNGNIIEFSIAIMNL